MSELKNIVTKIRHSYYGMLRVFAFIIAIAIVIIMMPRNAKFKYEFQKMQPWQHETLYAPFNFPIYKTDEQVWAEREAVVKSVHPIFIFDVSTTANGREQMMYQFDAQYVGNRNFKDEYRDLALEIYDSVQNNGIVSWSGAVGSMKAGTIADIVKNKVMSEKPVDELYSMVTASDVVRSMLDTVSDKDCEMFLNKLILGSLRQNVVYSENLTEQARKKALENVMQTFGMVQKDELIISEDEIVTEDKYMIIKSLQKEYENMYDASIFGQNNVLFGHILLVTIAFFCLYMILRLFHKDLFGQLKHVNMILLQMLGVIVPSYLVLRFAPSYIYIVPVPLLAMLLITFFNARVTIMVQLMTLLLISLAMPNPFQYFLIQLMVSLVVIFFMEKRRNRVAYFKTSLAVLVSYLIVFVGVVMMVDGDFNAEFRVQLLLYVFNAFLTLLALPLAFFFERIFGVVTELTLLELSNSNSPLLRKLASEAPGTFQHAMQVADLCEEVVYYIGGNTMLVRTGAMYHDVGKLRNPNYFIENQNGKYNPHEDLSNEESAQIIICHVIDGIEICHDYRIPEQIVDFVRTHHGTRRTEYFYRQELRENPDADERDFVYHGPIPFSKETAVLMMCDAVEAASRAMADKTEASISTLVENIIDGQIIAEQFDNSDITYRDIKVIKKVLKKKLINVYHPRVEYPK